VESTPSLQLLALGAVDALTRDYAGKDSRDAANFQRLRSRIRMPGDQSGEAGLVEPVKPVPEPMK
jgi:hypothetical protein